MKMRAERSWIRLFKIKKIAAGEGLKFLLLTAGQQPNDVKHDIARAIAHPHRRSLFHGMYGGARDFEEGVPINGVSYLSHTDLPSAFDLFALSQH
jgi:hypothetical protein